MKIVIGRYVYESEGVPFNNEDVSMLLESHGVNSISKLNAILEAIEKKNEEADKSSVPDLQPSEEEKAISDDMKTSTNAPQETPEVDASKETPEEPIEPEAPDVSPEAQPEPTQEPIPEKKPEQSAPSKPEKPKAEKKPLSPPTNPPAIEPKAELAPELKSEEEWLPSKKLSTLYNNFVDFFGEEKISEAGTVVGLNAPGLKQDSKYVQCDITADVQGSEDKPYRTWIKLRRKRNTQNWSFNNPCEVRCSCKAFAYYVANANIRNKSLAGSPARGKTYRDDSGTKRTINFLLPSPENNPGSVPALCKHLALVARQLLDNNMITEE